MKAIVLSKLLNSSNSKDTIVIVAPLENFIPHVVSQNASKYRQLYSTESPEFCTANFQISSFTIRCLPPQSCGWKLQ